MFSMNPLKNFPGTTITDFVSIFRAATDTAKKATFAVNTATQSKAEVKIAKVATDGTYDCVFKWGTVAEIRKNGLHVDVVCESQQHDTSGCILIFYYFSV